jgi:hypothetical protein
VSTWQVRDPLRNALTGGVRSDAETIVQPAELPARLGPTVPIERLGAGAMIGTPGCMAPVRALGHAGDHRANLFAVAVIRFEILVGRPPFTGGSLPEPLRRLTSSAPGEVAGVVQHHLLHPVQLGEEERADDRDPDRRCAPRRSGPFLQTRQLARRTPGLMAACGCIRGAVSRIAWAHSMPRRTGEPA